MNAELPQNGNGAPPPRSKRSVLPALLMGGGIGAGGVFGYAILELVRREPQMVLGMLQSWGPMAVIVFSGMFIVDRRFAQGLGLLHENTKAQQKLANAIDHIAQRDNREAEEQRRLMSYVGGQIEHSVAPKLEIVLSKIAAIEPEIVVIKGALTTALAAKEAK